jgi:flagellar biosynthetic protein FlhB
LEDFLTTRLASLIEYYTWRIDMAEDKSSKTEEASPRKKQKAREQGQVARSRDLTNIAGTTAAIATLLWEAPDALQHWSGLYRRMLDISIAQQLDLGSPVLYWVAVEAFRWTVPAMLAGLAMCTAFSLAQGGFVFAPEALAFNFGRMSPAAKLQSMFSLTGLSGLLKSLLPFAAMIYVCSAVLTSHWTTIVQASLLGLGSYASFLSSLCIELLWKCGMVLGLWAGVDYFLTWRKMEGDLKMTKQELKEEFKESDGNPAVKGRIRKMQRQVRKRQMTKSVETATVVVTNPTHFAVALRYETDMEAPVVIAKGQDLLAQEIKEVALWSGVPMVENRPLAQLLYRSVEVGSPIPSKLYTAVADILAFVYRARAEAVRAAARQRANASGNGGPS